MNSEQIKSTFKKTSAALQEKKITQAEHDAFLYSQFGTVHERDALAEIATPLSDGDGAGMTHRSVMLVTGFAVVMVSLFTLLFYSTGGITGAVVYDQIISQTYSESTSIPLELNGATRINISGSAIGDGEVTISLALDGAEYALWLHGPPTTAHASLEKSTYVEGEQFVVTAVNVSSAYLMQGDVATPLDGVTIPLLAPGVYTLTLIINDTTLSQEALSFEVVAAGTPQVQTSFATCGEVCSVNLTGNATINIVLTGPVNVTVDRFTIATTNSVPELITPVPDLTGEGRVQIDLSYIFADPDSDELFYESSHYNQNNESIEGSVLTITGEPGTYTYVVYASDLHELVSSNLFAVTLTSPNTPVALNESSNVSNTTLNESPGVLPPAVDINITLSNATPDNSTQNASMNGTANGSGLGCDDQNPNARPEYCLNIEGGKYFEEEVLLTNDARGTVGRITPIGNLLITGGVVENSLASPNPGDWSMGYTGSDFNDVATIWIDGATGDLHLRGRLVEENENLIPQEGAAKIVNRRGVYMAWADQYAGDLHVRGNVIPYRRSLS